MRHLLFLLLLPAGLSGVGCADAPPTGHPPSLPSAPSLPARPPVVPAPAPPPPTLSTSTSTAPPNATTAWRDVVDDALDRYGAVLTELVADPEALLRPDADLDARWRAVVIDGALSDEVTARAFDRLHHDRMVIMPGPHGRAYRHVAVDVGPADGSRTDHLSFTWCGYSPGVGVHVDTGEVLDDEVAHARGTGTLRLIEDTWRLETLDEFELDLLGPGADDPCRSG